MVEELFVCPDGEFDRVDKILARSFPEISRSLIKRAIESKKVRKKGGLNLLPKSKVYPGEELIIDLSREETVPLNAKNLPLEVLFEDEDLLVINKTSGMVVHPGDGTKDDTLIHALLHYCPDELCPIGAPERPGIVHRLDKETSGVMVVAKSEKAYYSLVEQFSQRRTEKEYYALVSGVLPSSVGQIEQPIGRHPKNRVKMAVVSNGKPALTDWKVISRFSEPFSLAQVRIHTGRTHQIRVHFSFLGYPLAGDVNYGAKKNEAFSRVMLHARCLKFNHPVCGKKLTFSADSPSDFKAGLNFLSVK